MHVCPVCVNTRAWKVGWRMKCGAHWRRVKLFNPAIIQSAVLGACTWAADWSSNRHHGEEQPQICKTSNTRLARTLELPNSLQHTSTTALSYLQLAFLGKKSNKKKVHTSPHAVYMGPAH